MYQPRTYRRQHLSPDLISFTVSVEETNLFISARTDLERKAYRLVLKYRGIIERYIAGHPEFLTSLKPIDIEREAPRIVKAMTDAARLAGVGPMAAVAGAIAQFVGEELAEYSPNIIIENGGDVYVRSTRDRTIGIFAGDSPLSGKIAIEIKSEETPCGVCTSSGTVGHSLSFGKADAVAVIAPSATLADAAATACANLVQTADDIGYALALAEKIEGVTGALIIKGDCMGAWGKVRLRRL
ncbi:UPF0280 family protein [Dehalogenimonas sp. THU2]|uniref:UPF0280 family protein n=1 Tax=Dehalogenimonas sp. THU2 TaxID=3151121 RepID=UPI0032184CD7